jgi:hypothetical protein
MASVTLPWLLAAVAGDDRAPYRVDDGEQTSSEFGADEFVEHCFELVCWPALNSSALNSSAGLL